MTRPPERFEDLSPDLQEKLRRATTPTGPTRIHRLAHRAFGWGIASAACSVFKWGGWIVGGICAPVALLSGIFALYAIRHETGWRGGERAWIGIVLALLVLVLVAVQMLRMRGLYAFTEEN